MPRTRSKPGTDSRAAICAAAEALMPDDPTVSFTEIAARAKVSHATIYRHFSDRGSLNVALMERSLARMEEEVSTWPHEAGILRRLLLLMGNEQARFRGLTAAVRAGAVDPRDVAELTERTLKLFEPAFRVAQREGEVRPELEFGSILVALRMIDGALGTVPETERREAAAEEAVDLLFAGLSSPA